MTHTFYKYEGTGNDFIIIDDRDSSFPIDNNSLIKSVCERRKGIGADGLILLKKFPLHDFEMIYYNADGFEGSLCGNGSRCVIAFAQKLGIIDKVAHFQASDGVHSGQILSYDEHTQKSMVEFEMKDTIVPSMENNALFVDTGSPHHVEFRAAIDQIDVQNEGRKIRYAEPYGKKGANVNFVEVQTEGIRLRTYERGVEDETLSCGTGVVAAAIAAVNSEKVSDAGFVHVSTRGGELKVCYTRISNEFKLIKLIGPVSFVFNGSIDV